MKKYFEYIGLIALTLFSFYYTDKVTKIMNSKDPVMISIKEYKDKTKESCKEGYYTNDGVILGVNGKIVDVNESYSNMVSKGYDEELMVFEEVLCKVNKEDNLGNYIIKGNEVKNSVSLFIEIKDLNYIDDIISISKNQNIKLNILVNGRILENNKEKFENIYKEGIDIIYNGNTIEDIEKYVNIMKSISNDKRLLCVSYNNIDNLDICKSKKINTIKTNYVFDKSIYNNTKTNLEKGAFYIYKENSQLLNEFNTIINHIKGKNIDIISAIEMIK